MAAEVHLHGRHLFNAVCMWVKPYAKKPKNWSCPYSYSVSMALDAVTRNLADRPTVVLGDFNTKKRGGAPFATYISGLLDAFGIMSAYHSHHQQPPGGERQFTYRHRGKGHALHHLDWCFVPKIWTGSIRSVSIGAEARWGGLSDHFPITVDVWDRELEYSTEARSDLERLVRRAKKLR